MQTVRTLRLVFLCFSVAYCGRTRIPTDEEVEMAYTLLNKVFPPTRGPVKVVHRIDQVTYSGEEDKYTLKFMAVDSTCQTLLAGMDQKDCAPVSYPTKENFKYFIGNIKKTGSGYEVLGGSFRNPEAVEFLEVDR
ncbi:hypothetical protein M514_03477 [Trichuris suis]|uniref:Cystatin domain-containing protein n=1 Tax=Trichuris suis TaxID=68888 RepID=A0A085NDN8_9BILA|nr:hypothetical protein M513_03477 [Trichuris suis]KFD67584.1 hypothetical protein M514_03477 [Trichuris suis]